MVEQKEKRIEEKKEEQEEHLNIWIVSSFFYTYSFKLN